MRTPEADWITKIPGARLLNIMRSNPKNYAGAEIISKISKYITYGADYEQTGPTIKILTKYAKEAGIDVGNTMVDLMKQWGWPNFADIGAENDMQEWLGLAEHYGIKMPMGRLRKLHHAQRRKFDEWDREKAERDREKAEREARQRPEELETIEADPDQQWASSMHQPFESKLAKILATI
jgi:hypothetical protein